tara:strand:- start:147 stop:641 length:495 start_codon:yes stop_codon:yes gene_type:complete
MDAGGRGIGTGVEFGFKSITRAVRKVGRTAGKVAKGAGRLAAKAASPVLSAAGAVAGGAGCAVIGVPPAVCAKGGAALGKAAGGLIAKATGVHPVDLGVDPAALVSGDAGALIKMGQGLLRSKGVNVPLSAEEAIYVAGRSAGLPPETVAKAQKSLATSKGVRS